MSPIGITPLPRVMETGLPPALEYRRRQSSDEADVRSEFHFMLGDYSSYGDGLTPVKSRRTRHSQFRKRDTLQSSVTIAIPASERKFIVLFVPTGLAESVSKNRRCQLSTFVDGISPGRIKEARVKTRKNVVAVDPSNSATISSLLANTSLM